MPFFMARNFKLGPCGNYKIVYSPPIHTNLLRFDNCQTTDQTTGEFVSTLGAIILWVFTDGKKLGYIIHGSISAQFAML